MTIDKDKMEKNNKDLKKEDLKNLFPEKVKKNFVSIKEDGFQGWFNKIKSNGLLDKMVWGVTFLIASSGIGLYFYADKMGKNMENQKITMGRVFGDFVVLEQNGPKPFVVSLKEVNTGQEYLNIKISDDCRLFSQKSYVGETMNLIKFTIVNINDENDKTYYFKGIEEKICEGRSFTPDSSNNFYIN